MAGFLYAISDVNTVKAADLEEAGLAGIFGKLPYCQRYTTKGPGGGACSLISLGEDADKLHFKPEQQHWQKSMNDKYWLGFYNDDRPKAEELARKEQIAGHEVELVPGQKWRIPLARIFPEGTLLPQTLLMGPEGKLIKEIIPEYAEFSRKAEKLWEDVQKIFGWVEGEISLTKEEGWFLAVEAITLNYHVGADEINALKLLSTVTIRKVFEAIVDLPTIILISAQKKTE